MNTNPCMPCEDEKYGFDGHKDFHEEHKPCDKKDHDCEGCGYQFADVSIPIEICPAADLGEITTECCGEPSVFCESEPCGNNCNIVITQSVKIKIPLKVGIRAIVGNSFISCTDGCCEK